MKICKYCGSQNDDQNRFCIHCGAALEQADSNAAANASMKREHFERARTERRAEEAAKDDRGERIIYTNVAPRSIALSIILSIVTISTGSIRWDRNVIISGSRTPTVRSCTLCWASLVSASYPLH